MRGKAAIFATIGLALLTGCNPMADRRYANEGAGVNLYATDVDQFALLEAYIAYICQQVGPGCSPATMTFVIAGMNDIDQRCDSYLTWLDGKRRDREPVLAQIAAVGAAVHAVMTVTGSSPKSLEILSSAFGLASASYSNWNSRLLISVEQSTVQSVVYKAQQEYRQKINTWTISDRPTAIYMLRNYLRTCMPIAIEASINITTTLVQRDAPMQATQGLVVSTTTQPRPTIIRDINAPLQRFDRGPGVVSETRVGPFEQRGMSSKDLKAVLDILGCGGSDLGPAGSPARRTLTKLLADNGRDPSDRVTNGVFIDLREIRAEGKKGTCSG